MPRISTLFVVVCACVLGAVGATQAAVHHRAAIKHGKTVKRAKIHGLGPPAQMEPANGAHFQQVPTLTWSAVSGAVEYEYQVAADPRFHSVVLGKGTGTGTSTTHNLAASLGKPVTDGTYYWRVRGLTASKEPGAWSTTRSLVKAWTEAPQLLGPANAASITWPSVPLVLSWSQVPSATEYIVTIATDEHLSNIVLGSATSPQKTWGSVLALPGTLPVGQYYWAITPVDTEGHRGTQSAVRTFNWSWPTSTSAQVSDLNPDPRVFEPQFSWAPIPGAARYEVEVNSAENFPVGSQWCCSGLTIGTSLTPTQVLANNEYYWRVRAIDASGNAGVWNEGAKFTKAFDSVTPTIPNLTMSELNGEPIGEADPKRDTPIVTWSPVPGASSYEVQVTHYVAKSGCNWAAPEFGGEKQTVETSTLAWTPLGPNFNHIGPTAWPSSDSKGQLKGEDTPYCVRVLARSDNDARGNQVVSNWTQIGGLNQPAFRFASQPAPGSPGPGGLETEASAYLPPRTGSTPAQEESCPAFSKCRSTPLFTWHRVPGASSYYIVIARDEGFTHVIDVASSVVPAYAPQLGGEAPLDDETTTYFWAVVPVNATGEVFNEPPLQDAPQGFNKSSVPPTPLAPINGAPRENQPTFSWTPAMGALNYTLQVSQDPTFGNPIDNVRTDSTAYTSSSTYPANVTLYWRVRANDTNPHNEGLNWSGVQTFTRTLPKPTPSAGNATGGEAIPVLSWSPVAGATAYDVHVEQPDGTTKDFTADSTAFTVQEWDGPGIWRWQARAEFPSGLYQQVPGGYFAPQPFAHTTAPPAGAQGIKSGARIVISWNPEPYAKEYEVEISTTDTFSFSTTIESRRTDQSSWAPNVDLGLPANRGALYWRVAAMDNKSNVGPFASGTLVPPKPKSKCVVKKVKTGKKTVKKCVAVKHKAAKTKKHH
jgi:hypothetical protein